MFTIKDKLKVTHQHVEENSKDIVEKEGFLGNCTEYCKKRNTYTLDPKNKEWNALTPEQEYPEDGPDWTRDCIFTRDMMRTIHTRITGKVLTIVDASVSDPTQRKAMKDLMHNAIWQETWQPIVNWMYEQQNKKGSIFPFYHEPQGLDG